MLNKIERLCWNELSSKCWSNMKDEMNTKVQNSVAFSSLMRIRERIFHEVIDTILVKPRVTSEKN